MGRVKYMRSHIGGRSDENAVLRGPGVAATALPAVQVGGHTARPAVRMLRSEPDAELLLKKLGYPVLIPFHVVRHQYYATLAKKPGHPLTIEKIAGIEGASEALSVALALQHVAEVPGVPRIQ